VIFSFKTLLLALSVWTGSRLCWRATCQQ